MHNALNQVTIPLKAATLKGFSISGLSTYLQVPEMDFCFDMGECPLSAVSLNHVFLTHSHGDHSRCMMRHESLRRMLGLEKEAWYYVPEPIEEGFRDLIAAEARFEGVPMDRFRFPNIQGICEKEIYQFHFRKDLRFMGFPVKHRVPAFGYQVYNFKKKLKEEYLGKSSDEIIALRQSGVEITKEVLYPKICFMGDCIGDSLLENEHIWQSEVLITECTFLEDGEEEMARAKAHVHIKELVRALETFEKQMKVQKLVLTHFSMKYNPKFIFEKVYSEIPERFHDLIHIFMKRNPRETKAKK